LRVKPSKSVAVTFGRASMGVGERTGVEHDVTRNRTVASKTKGMADLVEADQSHLVIRARFVRIETHSQEDDARFHQIAAMIVIRERLGSLGWISQALSIVGERTGYVGACRISY